MNKPYKKIYFLSRNLMWRTTYLQCSRTHYIVEDALYQIERAFGVHLTFYVIHSHKS